MIEEAYVSFETAKLLKEKGFNEKCRVWSWESPSTPGKINTSSSWESTPFVESYRNSQLKSEVYAIPTHQMVGRWLRENYDLLIIVDGNLCEHSSNHIDWIASYKYYRKKDDLNFYCCRFVPGIWGSYESAYEEAIKYCLKNLVG